MNNSTKSEKISLDDSIKQLDESFQKLYDSYKKIPFRVRLWWDIEYYLKGIFKVFGKKKMEKIYFIKNKE